MISFPFLSNLVSCTGEHLATQSCMQLENHLTTKKKTLTTTQIEITCFHWLLLGKSMSTHGHRHPYTHIHCIATVTHKHMYTQHHTTQSTETNSRQGAVIQGSSCSSRKKNGPFLNPIPKGGCVRYHRWNMTKQEVVRQRWGLFTVAQ